MMIFRWHDDTEIGEIFGKESARTLTSVDCIVTRTERSVMKVGWVFDSRANSRTEQEQ